MVVPVAIAAGAAGTAAAPVAKAAARKAADNPTETLFLAVLVGAVLIQGVKNLPGLGEFAWNKAVPFDVTAPFDYTYEAIKTTAALNEPVLEGFNFIGPRQLDPLETFIFGDEPFEAYEPGEMSAAHIAYAGARKGLFTGAWSRGGSLY